jgi:hypothetical protein
VWPVAVVVLVVVLEDVPMIERDGVGMAGMHDGKLPRRNKPHPLGLVASGTFVAHSLAAFPTMSHEGERFPGLTRPGRPMAGPIH